MSNEPSVLSVFELVCQIKSFVQATQRSMLPAYYLAVTDPHERMLRRMVPVPPPWLLEQAYNYVVSLDPAPTDRDLQIFQQACLRVGIEFSPLVGMVCFDEDESRYLTGTQTSRRLLGQIRAISDPVGFLQSHDFFRRYG